MNTELTLPVRLLTDTAKLPTRAHEGDAGLDLYADEGMEIGPGETKVVSTGIAVAIPPGYAAFFRGRSGLAARGIAVGGGVIDSGYRGEWKVVLHHVRIWFGRDIPIRRGDRIAQFVVLPVPAFTPVAVAELPGGDRGEGGFGSTGK